METPDGAPIAYPCGFPEWVDQSTTSAFCPRTVTCANVEGGQSGSTSVGNASSSSGPRHHAGRTRPGADLRRYQGVGYVMAADLRTIAIEQRCVRPVRA